MADTSNVSEKDRKRREFILNGKPMAVVLSISLPLILLGAFSYLSGIIDTLVVAKSDNNALSSVVMISQIKNLFTALGSGFATGGSIIVTPQNRRPTQFFLSSYAAVLPWSQY